MIVIGTRAATAGAMLSDAWIMMEPDPTKPVVGTNRQTPATRSTLPPVAPSMSIVTAS